MSADLVPTRGVAVVLDRERHLRCSFKTRKELIAAMGGEENLKKFKADDIPTILFYCLRHEDATLTVEQVEESLDMENLEVVLNCLMKAMGYKATVKVEGDQENPPKPTAEPAPGSDVSQAG